MWTDRQANERYFPILSENFKNLIAKTRVTNMPKKYKIYILSLVFSEMRNLAIEIAIRCDINIPAKWEQIEMHSW